MKTANVSYLERAQKLDIDEQERLLSRMAGKLPKRLQKEKLTKYEAIAIQYAAGATDETAIMHAVGILKGYKLPQHEFETACNHIRHVVANTYGK
jgi:hypothetical protein